MSYIVAPDSVEMETAIEAALKEALKAWDAEEDSRHPIIKPEKHEEKAMTTMLFPITTNVSRKTWEYISMNPGQTTANITAGMTKLGYNPSSVSSLVAQLIRQGQARKDPDRAVYITASEYQPIKSMSAKKKKNSSGIAALPVSKPEKIEEAPHPVMPLYQERVSNSQERDYAMEAKVIVAGVSIFVARELYNILHKLFKN
jgi:hypothetical protein